MFGTTTLPVIRDRRRGRPVASFVDARGAALAVATRHGKGFPGDSVSVQPGAMTLEPAVLCEPPSQRHAVVWPTVAAGGIALVVLVLSSSGSVGDVLAALGASAVVAAIAATVGAWRQRVLAARVQRAAHRVEVGRFDVVVSERADEAEHVLASWWDPVARRIRSSAAG
jgi:hypothetical protein